MYGALFQGQALLRLGCIDKALEVVDALLPIQTEICGARHSETLTTRWLGTAVVRDLGRYDEALKAVDALLTSEVEARSKRHPDTLGTLRLRESVLRSVTVRPDPPFRPLLWSAEIA